MSRVPLPTRRRSWTQAATIGDGSGGVAPLTCYLTCGEYPDGSLGEIFIVVARCGTALRAMLDHFARSFSTSLQYGVPVEAAVKTHRDSLDFLPSGTVRANKAPPREDGCGSDVTSATSIIDWVFQEVENAYCKPGGKDKVPIRLGVVPYPGLEAPPPDPPAPEKRAGPPAERMANWGKA
jgi:ribonucleoside-diphosphate reductase alpha chain